VVSGSRHRAISAHLTRHQGMLRGPKDPSCYKELLQPFLSLPLILFNIVSGCGLFSSNPGSILNDVLEADGTRKLAALVPTIANR
jgi:hypothetical protein